MMKASFRDLEELFKEQGMEAVFVAKTEEMPKNQLFVPLGKDDKNRDLLLQLSSSKQDLKDVPIEGKYASSELPRCSFIQFFLSLPFQVKDEHLGELARLLLLFNKSFEVPGFGMSEVDRVVYFRYMLLTNGGKVDPRVILSLLGMISVIVSSFGPEIEALGLGEKSLQEVVDEALAEAESEEM